MPLLSLPAELTDAIIDHLHADRTALAACSLVCHAFRDAAQYHLLATIYCQGDAFERLLAQLEVQDGPSRIEDEVIGKNSLAAQSMDDGDVSRAADENGISESFAQRVQEVWFRGQGSTAHTFSVGKMARVLAALPNLHTLHLAYLRLVPSDAAHTPDARGAEAQRRYRLRWLDLNAVHVPDMWLLNAMLGLWVEVEKLTLQCISPPRNYKLYAAEEEEMTRCESLVVDSHLSPAFDVWRILRINALKGYEVNSPRLKHVPKVLEMLGAAAGNLESFTLQLFSEGPVSGTFRMIS